VSIGDDVVLIGAQGDEHVTAPEWATRLGTIAYEITCAISARIPRTYLGTRR
jgi:alanine racemase